MGISLTSEWLYHNPSPSRPAYNISGRELEVELEAESEKAVELVAQEPSLPMLEALDGARQFRQCASCHGVSEQGPNRVGPLLWNIVNRPVATLDNYRYSRALAELGQSGALWDEKRLDAYIAAPQQAVPGTNMAFRGLGDSAARAAIIAYLRTLVAQEEQQESPVEERSSQ